MTRVEAPLPSRPHWIRDPAAIAVLASRVRQRVLDRLEAIAPASVAELARSLGLAPDRLYYHVGLLEKHRLVRRDADRGEGRHAEATYRPIAPRWHLRYDRSDPAVVRAIGRVTRAMLRQASRDFDAGWNVEGVRVHGPRRNLWSLRLEAALGPAEMAELDGHLQAIVDLLRRPRANRRGRRVALTWILAPLPPVDPPESAA